MGDSQGPQHPPVSQSPLVAALSTPSASMYNDGFNGTQQFPLTGCRPPWPTVNQNHNDGPQFNTPTNGAGGPIRVNQPMPQLRPSPYPPGHVIRINPNQHSQPSFNTPHGPPQQVVIQRPHSGHPQMLSQPMPINHGPPAGGPSIMHLAQTSGGLLDKMRLDDLVKQIDPNTNLEDNVKDALVEYCDDFISDVCNFAAYRANQQNAPNKKIEVRDVEMVLNMAFNMPVVPRAAVHVFGQPPTQYPRMDANPPTEAHKQRLMLIKKQLKKI